MTTDLLDFPPIEAPLPPASAPVPAPVAAPAPAAVAAVPLSIKETVLAQFKDAEAGLTALAAKYRDVAYDCRTTKGMNEAKAARADLRDNGRLALTKTEARVKADVNDLKRVMAAEVDRLVGIVRPVEDAIDGQIKAEEDRKAREKAERERIEAERVAGHQARMATISGYLTRCQQPGMTAERIQRGIELLAAVTFGQDWQEFAVPAADLQCKTLEAMRGLHAAAVEREAEATRLAEQRAEQERQAAELAEQKRRLDEAAEALRKQQQELAAQQAAAQAAATVSNPPFAEPAAKPAPDESPKPGLDTPAAQEGVATNPLQPQPVAAFPAGDAAAEVEAVAEAVAAADDATAPSVLAAAPEPVCNFHPQGEDVAVRGDTIIGPPGLRFYSGPAFGVVSDNGPLETSEADAPPYVAPPASATLTEHQLLLQEACALLDAWLVKPPTKKQAVECLAQINSLRARGGIPHPLS